METQLKAAVDSDSINKDKISHYESEVTRCKIDNCNYYHLDYENIYYFINIQIEVHKKTLADLREYCSLLENTHREMSLFHQEQKSKAKNAMKDENNRYYEQVTKLTLRVQQLELENMTLKSVKEFELTGIKLHNALVRSIQRTLNGLDSKLGTNFVNIAGEIYILIRYNKITRKFSSYLNK